MNNVKAAVWGAGGYVGAELLRLLVTHPHLKLEVALSGTHARKPIGNVYPGLAPWIDLTFADPGDWSWDPLQTGSWILFSAQPHVKTMTALPPVIDILGNADVKIVDLSGDFRLQDPEEYAAFYGHAHVNVDYLDRFVYGLPELNRRPISQSMYVANPGCFATCAQLSILPMASCPSPVECVAIDGKTGSSGAGVLPRETTHHPVRMNNFRAYKQLTHQHTPEIVGGWERAGGLKDTPISFVPQMAPMVRGIFTTAHFFTREAVSQEQISDLYKGFYEEAPFVRIVEGSPKISDIWGTNRCDISVTAQGRTVVVCAAIDNLVKGAAGQAVQNANLMCGFKETDGLMTPAPSPV